MTTALAIYLIIGAYFAGARASELYLLEGHSRREAIGYGLLYIPAWPLSVILALYKLLYKFLTKS
jgi:hypothetical protein